MPNALEKYLTDSRFGLDEVPSWTPVSRPEFAPLIGGFQFGVNPIAEQLPVEAFMQDTFSTVWALLPKAARDQVGELVLGIVDTVMSGSAISSTIGNVMNGVMAGIGNSVAYVNQMNEFAEWVVAWIEQTRVDNDQARYEARLEAVELLMEAGPAQWAGSNYFIPKYKREIKLKSDVWNMAWPPDQTTGFSAGGTYVPKTGGNECKDGGSDLAPKGSKCKGAVSLYPLYMPLWGNRALGSPGAPWSMRAGMERAENGGARIWELMSSMQGNLLADPMMNLLCSAEEVYWRMQSFLSWFFPQLTSSGIEFDAEFDEDNAGIGFYKTPGHLFGAYTGVGKGSTAHPDLEAANLAPGMSSFGGNGVTLANYNTVVSPTMQFLSLREATLRRPSFCQRAVEEGLVDLMPEPAAKAAVRASAAGEAPPPYGWKTLSGESGPGSVPSFPMMKAVKIKQPKRSKGGLGGLAVLGGVALGAMALSKK